MKALDSIWEISVYMIGQFGKELLLYVLDVQDPSNPVELARFVWPYPESTEGHRWTA